MGLAGAGGRGLAGADWLAMGPLVGRATHHHSVFKLRPCLPPDKARRVFVRVVTYTQLLFVCLYFDACVVLARWLRKITKNVRVSTNLHCKK